MSCGRRSFVRSVWQHRHRNFILQLRQPYVQILEALVNGAMVSIVLAQHATYGLLGPVATCYPMHVATAIMVTFMPGLILVRTLRAVIVLNRARRKRFRAWTGRKGVWGGVAISFLVFIICNIVFDLLPFCDQV